ncbi:MAG: hypothetical protein EU536_00255 [Promethearchaeota archaeon]|nr:MAG: hypothetical protein EU536_00255 [Candidatus Lokiarchaeota archaeon]
MQDILGGFNLIFEFFGQHISTMLLIGGFFAGFYFVYWFFVGSPKEGEETAFSLKLMTYLGVLIGVFLVGGGINAWTLVGVKYYTLTCVLAIIVGIALILRPIKDVPWAAIIGVIAGAIVVFISASYLKFMVDGFAGLFGVDPYWILIILFVLILLLTYLAFKLIEDLGRLLGKILSSRPASAVILVLCVVEAILAFFGSSIEALFYL